ncbi:oligopeptidase A [Psychrosphaera sp. B3R10]|uniref:oligopeptidase A n=1 Tax=unclassified Psychrosphaera TaxID=2641570 RepID=UPI001C0807E7|nr:MULTISPECIES: oligopeptidase A [unclassified Psychrosphaera]MBU2883173.1 oligopeptidase A [Psychrosphaera sp. I2R16]MBU2988629.1 oligopeptidase A [Psychrosphaera sp. B3R10]
MSDSSNPLLSNFDLPPFSQIQPQHIKPAVESLLDSCKKSIEQVVQLPTQTWQTLVVDIDKVSDQFGRAWSPISHINSVLSSDEWREAYESCLPIISEYSTWVGQHKGLFDAYYAYSQSDEFATLSTPQKKVITNALRDFKLSGIDLPEDKQKRYGEIQAKMSELSSTFSNNVLDATQAFQKVITDEVELAGLPDSAIAAAKQMAEVKEIDGWLFTLDFPSYLPVMTYSENAELRKEMSIAFSTRASDQGPYAGQYDNSEIIDELMALRHELAQLLGFESFAESSLATKMAENTQQVLGFLSQLAEKSLPQAQQEVEELRQFAQSEFGVSELNPWDYAFYSEKLKQAKYAISDEALRPYFPESKVLDGLFTVVNRLFGVTVTEVKTGIDKWHKDVKYFDIVDKNQKYRGSFYLDLYAREKKRGGAWMDDCRGRVLWSEDQLQNPVAYLTCNFNQPIGDNAALFTHDEVVTLFHEFGHGIHHMLTQVDEASVSGINGVAWDAVELPSQFLENWCWEEDALAFISGHFETGEPLPKDMLDKMLAAKNFQSAMQMARQLEFSLFDFRIHAEYDPAKGSQIQAILDDVRQQVAVVQPPAYNRFQHGFGHIFAGGYAAGYYSYKWAEVLSADAFSKFEEDGIFNSDTGNSFLTNILEKGGSAEPMELFKAFRGREPEIDALLRHCGIAA